MFYVKWRDVGESSRKLCTQFGFSLETQYPVLSQSVDGERVWLVVPKDDGTIKRMSSDYFTFCGITRAPGRPKKQE